MDERPRWGSKLVVALLIAGGVGWLWYREHTRSVVAWAHIRERAAQIEVEVPHGTRAHMPLIGAAQPGEAVAHYRRAGELWSKAWSGADGSMHDFLEISWQPDLPEDADALIAPLLPALDAVAAGAMSETIRMPSFEELLGSADRGGDPGDILRQLIGPGPLCATCRFAIRVALAKGDARGAIERTAALLGLVHDQMTFGLLLYELMAAGGMEAALAPWTDDSLHALAPEHLRELSTVLANLDGRCAPATAALKSEFLWLLRDADAAESRRHASREDLTAFLGLLDELPATATSGWSRRERALKQAVARLDVMSLLNLPEVEFSRRRALAELRMLRLAVLHHLGEPLPSLADPLGDGDLQVVDAEGGWSLRSQGANEGKPIARFVARR